MEDDDTTNQPPRQLACPDCDALYTAPAAIAEGEWAVCARCGAHLFTRRINALHRATALAFAAAWFFVLANIFPFMSLQADYRKSAMELSGTVSGLEEHGYPVLGALVGVFMLGAPTLIIGGMLYVLVPLLRERRLPGAGRLYRVILEARRWNMVEVYLLGVLVSLLKLGKLATLSLGTSFWAFVGLIVCLTAALTAIDHRELWVKLEGASR